MSLRRWLAECLYPEVFEEQFAYRCLKNDLQDAKTWLGEFPIASAVARWALDNDADLRRPLGTRARGVWSPTIDGFREEIRRLYASKP